MSMMMMMTMMCLKMKLKINVEFLSLFVCEMHPQVNWEMVTPVQCNIDLLECYSQFQRL